MSTIQFRYPAETDAWSEPVELDADRFGGPTPLLDCIESAAMEWFEDKYKDDFEIEDEPDIEMLVDGKKRFSLEIFVEYVPSFSCGNVKEVVEP